VRRSDDDGQVSDAILYRKENPAKKVFRDLCDKYMRNQLYHPCEEYTLVDKHNTKVIKYYDILDVKRCCNMCERVMCKCSM